MAVQKNLHGHLREFWCLANVLPESPSSDWPRLRIRFTHSAARDSGGGCETASHPQEHAIIVPSYATACYYKRQRSELRGPGLVAITNPDKEIETLECFDSALAPAVRRAIFLAKNVSNLGAVVL